MKELKQKLKARDPIIGSWINTCSPVVAELMAEAGFDFLCVDAEHSPVDLPLAHQLFQAISSGNPHCAPLIRTHGIDYAFVKRYLDSGAHGVIAPMVRSIADVDTLVEAIKYPPIGLRGVGFCRANKYGVDLKKHFDEANGETLLVLQIEHISAVDQIDAILSHEEVDVAFIGPYDLSASMGLTAQFDHPDFLEAQKKILASCERHEVAPGIHVVQPNVLELKQRLDEGYRFLAFSLDITFLNHTIRPKLDEIRNFQNQ